MGKLLLGLGRSPGIGPLDFIYPTATLLTSCHRINQVVELVNALYPRSCLG